MKKSIKELVWDVNEDIYRKDDSMSYSKLSSFLRDGPRVLIHEEKKRTASLRFGSLVDSLLTEPEVIEDKFLISNHTKPPDALIPVLEYIWNNSSKSHGDLFKIDKKLLLKAADEFSYCPTFGSERRIERVMVGTGYFNLLSASMNKIVVAQEDYNSAVQCIESLKSHPFTREIINTTSDDNIEALYQPKFRTTLNDVRVRCMFDKLIVDHVNKEIYPYDLKTTSKQESGFEESILEWNYYIQGTLYPAILKDLISKDEYFKDFTIKPFTFIVINRFSLKPLCWRLRYNSNIEEALKRKGYKNYETLLEEIKWHKDNGLYDYPKEAYLNKGIIDTDILKFL